MATSQRTEGKNQKSVLLRLGYLSDTQASACKKLLKLLNQAMAGEIDESAFTTISEIEIESKKQYLDCLVLVKLWEQTGLPGVFKSVKTRAGSLSIEQVAIVLTLNRLLDPATKTKTIEWFQRTMLAEILGMDDPSKYNASKVYRDLAKIHKLKPALEHFCGEFSAKHQELAGVARVHYFDGTTTWLEGGKCKLSAVGKEKTRGFYPDTLGFMLLTDNLGYPVAWKVIEGNAQDTSFLLEFVEKAAKSTKLNEVTFCFDRGVASKSNFDGINTYGDRDESINLKFISGLADNQIKSHTDPILFAKEIRPGLLVESAIDKAKEAPKSERRKVFNFKGFLKYSKRVFYKDLGKGKDGYRRILSFNADIFKAENTKLEQEVEATLMSITSLNTEYAFAKKDRDHPEARLKEIFNKYKTSKYFDYTAVPRSSYYNKQSYSIKVELNNEALEAKKSTSGMMMFITNHTEPREHASLPTTEFKVSPVDIIGHYRVKNVVENSFRELKTFLKVRPVHVWKEDHVHAHFDVAIMAYFINTYIYRTLFPHQIGLRAFYKELQESAHAIVLKAGSGASCVKREKQSVLLKHCLKALGLAYLTPNTQVEHKQN